MSLTLGQALVRAFNIVEPTLEAAAIELLEVIFSGPDPRANIEHARRVLTTEASFAAADLVLAGMLPPDSDPDLSPPAGSEPPPSNISLRRPP